MDIISPSNDLSPYRRLAYLSKLGLDNNRSIYFLKDDFLIGGFKQRALISYLNIIKAKGYNHIIYPAIDQDPNKEFLSLVCKNLNLRCSIFTINNQESRINTNASQNKASVYYFEKFETAFAEAKSLTALSLRNCFLPFDFKTADYETELTLLLGEKWDQISRTNQFSEIWIPMLSGVIFNAIQKIIPQEIRINLVDFQITPDLEVKVNNLKEHLNIGYFKYQSNHDYPSFIPTKCHELIDSNVFQIANLHACHNSLWWGIFS